MTLEKEEVVGNKRWVKWMGSSRVDLIKTLFVWRKLSNNEEENVLKSLILPWVYLINFSELRERETTAKRIELDSGSFETVSYIPGWPQTHYILKDNLELQIFLPLNPSSARVPVRHTLSHLASNNTTS